MVMKLFSLAMLPLGVLIILEQTGMFTINIFIDKVMVGAILMIVFQIIHLFNMKKHNGHISGMNLITSAFFIVPAIIYFLPIQIPNLEMILGVMMLLESIYSLH